jgi:general secretion pathway protein K
MIAPQKRRSTPSRQKGVALITAVLIGALATILAVQVGFDGYLDQRRSATAFALDQGFEVALGAEAWSADILALDAKQGGKGPKTDDFTEAWATPIPPIPIDAGEVQGQLEDMQGRFNLNSLIKLDPDANQFVKDPAAAKRFEHLLELINLDTKWASVIVDWIDPDDQTDGTNGAEDSTYSSLTPAYRTPNMPITRSSELLAIAGFNLDLYRKLEPFVTALPIGTTINLCTAPLEVIDSLTAKGKQQFSTAKQTIGQTRTQRCFPTVADFKAALSDDEKNELFGDHPVVDQNSSYFRASIWVTIGTTQFTLYSLLKRDNNLVRPILRSFGTP